MFPIPQQFSTITQAQFEAQLKIMNVLTGKAFESAGKVIALNISATKATLEKSSNAAKQLFAAKDPRDFFALSATQVQPDIENVLAYGRQLFSIAASSRAELIESAQVKNTVQDKMVASAAQVAAKPVVATPDLKPAAAVAVAAPLVKATSEATPVQKPAAAPVAKPTVTAAPALKPATPAATAAPTVKTTPAAAAKSTAAPVIKPKKRDIPGARK